ncbi:hypothetical protein ACHAXR_001551, partial [Thalassiosira sp. AJA248-18]
MPNTDASRRTPFHSTWSLWILITLIGGIFELKLLPSSRTQGGHARPRLLPDMLFSETEAEGRSEIQVDQYNITSEPGRLFRNNDEKNGSSALTSEGQHSMPNSTYERLWPGFNLPKWARKVRRFDGFQPPKGNSMCFVHIGKTAGSSIGCALGFRLHCGKGSKQYLPGRLPKSATNAFHKDVYDCPYTTDSYLFPVRDPLARFRSAFVYGRPDENGKSPEHRHMDYIQQLYIDCPTFSTANDLAASGLTEDGEASDECKQRARDLLRGTAQYEDHIFYNFQYYLEAIPEKSNIIVIRTEHMEEDWNSIELGLGGRPRTNMTFPHDNSNPKEARDMVLGEDERMLLCHEL